MAEFLKSGVNAWGKKSALILHEKYIKFGSNSEVRCYAYREFFTYKLSEYDLHLIECW